MWAHINNAWRVATHTPQLEGERRVRARSVCRRGPRCSRPGALAPAMQGEGVRARLGLWLVLALAISLEKRLPHI